MGSFSDPQDIVRQADSARQDSNWVNARLLYGKALEQAPGHPGLMHNLALCAYALGDFDTALNLTREVLARQPGLWQAEVIHVQAMRHAGDQAGAWKYLRHRVENPDAPLLLKAELANLALNEFGMPLYARSLMAACAEQSGEYAEDAELTALMASLYDRDGQSAEDVVARVKHFAQAHLATTQLAKPALRQMGGKLRIGLLSPFFNCSPVYFFSIGALRLLAKDFDLAFFNRGSTVDWAGKAFREIAAEWVDCAHLPADDLRQLIERQALDVLVDMGGWSDVTGLRAIAGKPARRMYKWVGGQSVTTGLNVFDGWITDSQQSLPEHQAHHTEPLAFMEGGYVTYAPPSYMPHPVPSPGQELWLGVVTNPAKLSTAFMVELPQYLVQAKATGMPFRLQCIDRRFAHADVRNSILAALDPVWHDLVEFIAPGNHQEYLAAIGRLSAVIDTFPYSGGLTAIEAIVLGVPIITRPGVLFSERHAWAHLAYSSTEIRKMQVIELPKLAGLPRKTLAGGADRFNHKQLADSLAKLFSDKSVVT